MSDILNLAISTVQVSKAAWCRYITGNDTGKTGSHQAGFYVPKCASSLLFEKPGIKGENKEKMVNIKWQNDFVTESCMKYYGQGTRNEYRITRFGHGFPFLQDDNVGDLLIIAKHTEEDYSGFVLSSDDDIDGFLDFFNLSPKSTNQLIDINGYIAPNIKLSHLFDDFISNYESFPDTKQMATGARFCYNKAYSISSSTTKEKPDMVLLKWIDTEYKLFRCMEQKLYSEIISTPFNSLESFIKTANEVLNRRKSRAGKSLENHLSCIFSINNLIFEEQAETENNKKPDFLFPNSRCYKEIHFPSDNLIVLGAKTTCKDRWRQVLSEADKIEEKHLFTLQQGISRNQLKEMHDSKLRLVVPSGYIHSFPKEYQSSIWSLSKFILFVKEKQEHLPKYYLLH